MARLPEMHSTIFFQQKINQRTFSTEELYNISRKPLNIATFQKYLKCNDIFQHWVATGSNHEESPQQQRRYYLSNLACIASISCQPAFEAWKSCTKEKTSECGLEKRQLERCLRGSTESMFQATNADLF